ATQRQRPRHEAVRVLLRAGVLLWRYGDRGVKVAVAQVAEQAARQAHLVQLRLRETQQLDQRREWHGGVGHEVALAGILVYERPVGFMPRLPELLPFVRRLRAFDPLGARLADDLLRQLRLGANRLRRRRVELDEEGRLFGVRATEVLVD